MKKIISAIIVILVIFSTVKVIANKIPEDAIRIRVVANSNTNYDQEIKQKVSNLLKKDMYYLLKNTKNSEEAEQIIQKNLDSIDNNIYSLLKKENYNLGYTIHYGQNYFPEKNYKGITYDAGYYKSVLVTLGSGEGENWWCVLFPPFCLVEAEESEKIEYKFFLQELIEKIL